MPKFVKDMHGNLYTVYEWEEDKTLEEMVYSGGIELSNRYDKINNKYIKIKSKKGLKMTQENEEEYIDFFRALNKAGWVFRPGYAGKLDVLFYHEKENRCLMHNWQLDRLIAEWKEDGVVPGEGNTGLFLREQNWYKFTVAEMEEIKEHMAKRAIYNVKS